MSGRSGGNRRGKEPKASQNPGSGKMGGPTQPNLQKQGGAPTPKEPAPNDKHSEFSSKLQPTAEQIRLATLIQDSSKIAQSDEETATKIRELVELTKCDGDKAALVLHDCDYDLMKAVDAILEGGEPVEQQWTESVSRKKKKQQSQPLKDEGTNEDAWDIRQDDGRDKSKRGVKGLIGAGGAANGQRRGAERSGRGGPPRLRRGRGGGTAGSPREGDGKGFEADFGEDGRGRRAVNGPGRGGRGGRGGGRVPRTFRNQQQSPDVEGFPQSIDTWTNSQAEGYSDSTKTRDLKVGRWDDDFPSTDDWDNEEWTGSLADTRVFTPSSATAPGPNPAAPAQVVPSYDDEKEVEELPKPIGSGASAEKAPSSMPAPAAVPEAPVSPNIPKQLAGPPGLSYSPHHQGSATLDLATLLGTKPSQPQQQPADMGDQRYMNPMKPVTNEVSQPPTNDSVNLFPQMSGQSQQGSGVPVQRSRLKPRPSKIPATAVEMPHDPIAVLDVQFGGLAFSEISSPPGTGSTVASDPSIVSYSVATSSSLPQSSVPSYAPPKDNSSVPTTVGGVERKPTASPGTSYYNTASHATPPPAQVSSAPSHAPPSTSATGMEGSEQVHHQQAVNGPYAPPQSTQGYAVIQPGQYGVKPPSTGAETVVSGGMYAGSYQPNMNGAPSAGKIPPATQNTKDNLPSTSVAPPAAYRQNAAPSKDGVGVGKPQMQMAGYPAPVTAGAPGMAPIVGHQFYAVGPPPTGPPHYYQTQQVYPVPDDLSLLTQRMPPMQSATAAPTVSTSSNRDSSAAGSGLVGHHQYQTSSSDKYGQTATTSAPVSVAGTNVQVRGGEQGSASPAAPTAAVPTAIPVSQPSAAHYAHAPLPLFINYQQQYQGMVPTTFPATAFQTHIFPVPQAANNVHGHGSNSSSQYQKPNAFVQHPYSYSHDHIGNAEYGKSYLSNSKPTAQSGMGGGAPTMQGSDVGMYGNKKVAGYDKFNPSTPQMAGTAGPSPHYGQYHPAMVISGLPPTANAAAGPQAQQHPSQMSMPVHAQSYMQDGSGANRNPGGMPGQNKVPSKPGGYGTGWSY